MEKTIILSLIASSVIIITVIVIVYASLWTDIQKTRDDMQNIKYEIQQLKYKIGCIDENVMVTDKIVNNINRDIAINVIPKLDSISHIQTGVEILVSDVKVRNIR